MHDVHTHFIPEDVILWIKDNKKAINAKWEQRGSTKNDFLVINDKWAFELKDLFINSSLYLRAQEKVGINHALVSPVPQLFLYDFPEEITAELCSVYNRALKKMTISQNDRLYGLATIPLNNPLMAAEELHKSMSLGLKGAIVGPGCNGKMLSDESLNPFWEVANHHKAIIFVHPLLNEDPRLKKRKMPNLIGVPWETTICATDILLSGLLDKYSHVKILLAHGGGYLPYQIGRLTKGYEKWNQVGESITEPPLSYLKRFWYDTVLWNKDTLNYLTQLVGEEQIVSGSDFPFDLSVWPPFNISKKGFQSLLSN